MVHADVAARCGVPANEKQYKGKARKRPIDKPMSYRDFLEKACAFSPDDDGTIETFLVSSLRLCVATPFCPP